MVSVQHTDVPPQPSSIPRARAQARKAKGKETEIVEQCPKPDQERPWEWTTLTDSYVSRQKPIFTKDGLYFFVLAGSTIKIYATATGEVVSILSRPHPDTHLSEKFSCATLNPRNPFQLITGSLDGTIAVWDFLDSRLLQAINITYPIHHICAHEDYADTVFISALRPSNRPKRQDDNGVVLRVSLIPTEETADRTVQSSSSVTVVGKTRAAMGLAISSSGRWLVAIAGHKAYVSALTHTGAGFTKYVSPEWLTCIAFHPTDDYFATGDEKGIIRLWYCLADHKPAPATGIEKKAQTTSFHWHAHPMSSLSFTANGAYLLSGGEEGVLVIWQLESGKREFVPRLGAPISTITVSPSTPSEEYLIGLSDSAFIFVNSTTLKVSRTYTRMKIDPMSHLHPWTPTPLAAHSLSSTLILPSPHQSSLQIYSPTAHKVTVELEVSPSNRVSKRDFKPIAGAVVERVATSSCGQWMATVDVRFGGEESQSEIYLKFWSWDSSQGSWVLNTRINKPHGNNSILSMSFRPSCGHNAGLWLATCGEDGKLKIWRIRTTKTKNAGVEEYWVARSTITFKSATPIFASWSPDGSALAVSFEAFVVVYDPKTNIANQVLTFAECADITACHFVGTGGRYLACIGVHDLVLWDLICRRVQWHYHCHLPLSSVVSHPSQGSFAVFHASYSQPGTKVLIFSTQSPIPLETRTLPFALRNIVWLPRHSSGLMSYSLVGITHSWDVVGIADAVKLLARSDFSAVPRHADAQSSKSIFQDVFGKSAFTNASVEAKSEVGEETGKAQSSLGISGLLDTPTYLVGPISELFDSLMGSFLLAQTPRLDPSQVSVEEDIEMQDETVSAPAILDPRIRPARQLSELEMDSLVDLFKKHALNDLQPPSKSGSFKATAGNRSPKKFETPVDATNKHPSPATSSSTIDSPINASVNRSKRKVTSQ